MSKGQINSYARFSGLAIQMVVTIFVFNKIGIWLDTKFPNDHEIYMKIITLLGVFLSIFLVIYEAVKAGKENE